MGLSYPGGKPLTIGIALRRLVKTIWSGPLKLASVIIALLRWWMARRLRLPRKVLILLARGFLRLDMEKPLTTRASRSPSRLVADVAWPNLSATRIVHCAGGGFSISIIRDPVVEHTPTRYIGAVKGRTTLGSTSVT